MRPARRFFRAFSQRLWFWMRAASDWNSSNETLPFFAPSPWQSKQYSLRIGSTLLRNSEAPGTSAPTVLSVDPSTNIQAAAAKIQGAAKEAFASIAIGCSIRRSMAEVQAASHGEESFLLMGGQKVT